MNLKKNVKEEDFTHYQKTALERREVILQAMNERFSQGKNCLNCQGFCCTASHNSMQVTPLEALDLYFYLKGENRLTESLKEDLQASVKKYRLDHFISTGRNSSFRRSYTCPFYQPGSKGCTISPRQKPYGCLAFNPLEVGVSEEGHCASDISLLQRRENKTDDQINLDLQLQLGLIWEKECIPVALLNLIELFEHKSKIH